MNTFCWWQVVFGIGAALGAFGLANIVRYVLYSRMRSHAENIVDIAESLFEDYRADSERVLDMGAAFALEGLADRIQEHFDDVQTLAKWLPFPDKEALQLIGWGRVLAYEMDKDWKPQIRDILHQGATTRNEFIDKVEPTLKPRVSAVLRAGGLFRDSATRATIWAAVSFGMGSLVVGLFSLWQVR